MMFDWLIPPCLDFVTRQCRELVRTSPMHMISSMLTMYSILLDELRQVKNIYIKESIKGTSYFLFTFYTQLSILAHLLAYYYCHR